MGNLCIPFWEPPLYWKASQLQPSLKAGGGPHWGPDHSYERNGLKKFRNGLKKFWHLQRAGSSIPPPPEKFDPKNQPLRGKNPPSGGGGLGQRLCDYLLNVDPAPPRAEAHVEQRQDLDLLAGGPVLRHKHRPTPPGGWGSFPLCQKTSRSFFPGKPVSH